MIANEELLADLTARAASKTRIDMDFALQDHVNSPLTDEQYARSVQALGFLPHPLYVDVLKKIGNGGFGPGYGLIGLIGGAANEDGETAVDLYLTFTTSAEDHVRWAWPRGLLPICSLGCAMYYCIDCLSHRGDIAVWEPNLYEEGMPASTAIFDCGWDIETWLSLWARGEDIWAVTKKRLGLEP